MQEPAPAAAAVPEPASTHQAGDAFPAVDIGLADAAAPVRMKMGQMLRIHLPASPASGYKWELQRGPPPFLSIEVDPGTDPLTITIPGTRSRFMSWRFRAKGAGRGSLQFRYGRPWAKIERTQAFRIDVR